MRNLTIQREKSVVACLAKIKVYIEDPAASELTIQNVPCRKLGEIKNGETKTFEIGDEAAKLYVIGDKLSKNYCNEVYQIPEGTEDLSLKGKNQYNPFAGNPFRFHGVTDPLTLENRKKGSNRGALTMGISIAVGATIGIIVVICVATGIIISGILNSDREAESKTFTAEDMKITLTDEFITVRQEGFTACYGTGDVTVLATEEAFSLMAGFSSYTIEDYGNLILQNNTIGATLQTAPNGLVYFEYEATSDATYRYRAYLYKESDAFWMIQFAVEASAFAEYEDEIRAWASSVVFDEE